MAELEREWRANRSRQRLQTSKRLLKEGKFQLELCPASDDANVGAPAFQEELHHFTRLLTDAGVAYGQTAFVMDSADGHGFLLAEFSLAIKTLGPAVIAAVTSYATAWVVARNGRKVRLRIGEVEAEASTEEKIKKLLEYAAEFQGHADVQREKQSPSSEG